MASSMLTAEMLASTESDVDKALKAALHTCANDPDFAVVCDFLQKFSQDLGLDLPNFKSLLQWLTKTDEVSPQLREMQIKLLRKTRKTVHEKSWESALSKFCFTYSAQDGWEIERFGYKNSSVKVKLRILRELLECQFESNTKFRAKILGLSADSLRSKPIGHDRQGHAYWVTQDNDCNIRIYQEHLDEDIWQVVATNRDEFVNLIKRLRGSEVVQPCQEIGIADEDSSSSNHVDSVQKALPPDEKDESQEDEQKVPKLSIKLMQVKSPKESSRTKDIGKGEEELAEEEDAKLLKENSKCSATMESDDEEFEEIEEEYDDESGSDAEIEEEFSDEKQNPKKSQVEQNQSEKDLNSKDEKKVKPLLISQNKVLSNNENYSTSNTAGKKRTLDEVAITSPQRNENQIFSALKKSRPSLLHSKKLKITKKYDETSSTIGEDNEDESDDKDIEVEEEIEEEEIDSAAAEEDENEEKMFEEYDDEEEEEEEVGEEICDPILQVSGEGSGKDCEAENYLYFIEYEADNDNPAYLSDAIIEDVYYVHGDGDGKDCLVGNKSDDTTDIELKPSSEIAKSNEEEKSALQSDMASLQKQTEKSVAIADAQCPQLTSPKIEVTSTEDSLDVRDNFARDLDTERKLNENKDESHEIEKQLPLKEEIIPLNGDNKSENINLESENIDADQCLSNKATENATLLNDTNKTNDENILRDSCTENNQQIDSIINPSVDVDVLTLQAKASAMESVKKELRESKQKFLDKNSIQGCESSNATVSSPPLLNRKRRLTDQLQITASRPQNSESEIDCSIENAEDLTNDKDHEHVDSGEDVGGKRLKMRPKQTNTEQRKKIEAKKVAHIDGTTSSSGDEEDLKARKKITLPKQNLSPPTWKSENKTLNVDNQEDNTTKDSESFCEANEKKKSIESTNQPIPVKKQMPSAHTKAKPSLAEIIEKKLKKTAEKVQTNISICDQDSNSMEASTTKNVVPCLIKSTLNKSPKKDVLNEMTKRERDEEEITQELTNSQEMNPAVFYDNKSFEAASKSSDTQKHLRESLRKRRSSEEAAQNDSPEEPEAKKEVSVFEENVILKSDKPNETKEEDLMKTQSEEFELTKASAIPVVGRRSGRRGKLVPTYVEKLQPKRCRGSIKCSPKTELASCEKDELINKHNVEKEIVSSNLKQDALVKTNGNELQSENLTSLPKANYKKLDQTKNNSTSMETIKNSNVEKSKLSVTTKTPVKAARKQREVDATNIIDVDSETPVRQSRRIAQQKIREEAERRKLEEIALRTMKQELKKKKKAEKKSDPTLVPPTEPSSESEESDIEIKRKVQKKKCPGKNGNWSSGSEEQEDPEEDDEEPAHYYTDPGSPLFKSDHEFSPESDIEDESQVVPMKRARTVRKEDADTETAAKYEEEEACQKCNKSDHPEWILLCDNCDKGYHCSCLSPVLFYIPEGDWYCPPCQQEQLIKALEKQLKEFDDLVETKKRAEEQEKRMAEEERARQEREQETTKLISKRDRSINSKRHNDNSSPDHSHEEDDDEETTSSDDSKGSGSKKQCSKNKSRNRSKNSNSEKRNYRDRRHNATRSRRIKLKKHSSDFSSDSQNSTDSKSDSKSNSMSSSTYSESDNEPIYKLRKRRQINVCYRLNEYDDLINSALKKEMDEAAGAGNLGRGKDISTIIEADKEEKARQKQIEDSEVEKTNELVNVESVKDEKQNSVKMEELNEVIKDEKEEVIEQDENDSDAEPIIRKLKSKPSQKKKPRKLTTLDISSEDDDGSDEDFKGSSFDDDEEEEDTSISASNSDSSLEIYKRHGKSKKKRRRAARRALRESRRDRRFLVDDSDDEEIQRPKSKKKRKDDSDYTESEAEDDISELSENIDSADLCDDTTTDDSDGAWRPNKRKKAKKSNTSVAQKSPKSKSANTKKVKKVEYSDDDVSESEDDDDEEDDENEGPGSGKGMGKQPRSQPLKSSSSSTKTKGKGKEKPPPKTKKKNSSEEDTNQTDSEDSTRRTRGRRYAYIEDFDDDSSDGGIKPGVKRPDTPPEEREKFIKRQEEIKRMLAEKNAEGAKLAATPRLTPIKSECEKDKRSPSKAGGDSLSTVPLSVIRQAKVLDIDYLQRRGENLEDLNSEVGEVDDDFDDADLPDDLPEDMDEDAIARMVEDEEEFGASATRDLPAADDVIRTTAATKTNKTKELEKTGLSGSSSSLLPLSSQQTTPTILPTQTSCLQEPVRKRLPMPTIHPPLLRHQYLLHESMSSTQHLLQRHGGPATSQLLQNALSAPLSQSLDRNYPSTSHHSLINKIAHSIPLQPTVSHALSASRPPQPSASSTVTKASVLIDQADHQKSSNAHTSNESKPRGRRKKITPLRDSLQKQQAAAAVTAATATSSALASSLVKTNDPGGPSPLPSVIKSGSTAKIPMHASVITSVPQPSHPASNRPGVPMPPIGGAYVRTDGPRFYDAPGNRIMQSSVQRQRGPPQMPPSLLPPHPANRSSYGLPPPLKGSNSVPSVSLQSSPSGSIRNPIRHVPPPYLGIPPNARHGSHLNIYRPPMFANPHFGPRVNLRPPNMHSPEYSPSSRVYSPYSFYPPPPPLTTPGQRPGSVSILRPPTQMPSVQSNLAHPPASVIVSAASSKLANAPNVPPQPTPPPTNLVTDNSVLPKSVVITQESSIKIAPPTSSSPTPIITQTETMTEPRKSLTTLQAYVANSAKKSPVLPISESSGSRSPPNPSTDVNDDSSVLGSSENTSTTEQPIIQESQASEFSGLVSYFSSQHDDYNT